MPAQPPPTLPSTADAYTPAFRADRFALLTTTTASLPSDDLLDMSTSIAPDQGTPATTHPAYGYVPTCIFAWYVFHNPLAGCFRHRGWIATRAEHPHPAAGTPAGLFWGAAAFAHHFGLTYSEAVNLTSPYCYPVKRDTHGDYFDPTRPTVLARLRETYAAKAPTHGALPL